MSLPRTARSSSEPVVRFAARLGFADVSVVPRLSEIAPTEVSLEVPFMLGEGMAIPLMPSPMDSVISPALAAGLMSAGGVATFPTAGRRPSDFEEIFAFAASAQRKPGLLLHPEPTEMDPWLEAWESRIGFVALDTLHFAPEAHIRALRHLARAAPRLPVMSGNVVHDQDAERVIDEGASAVRVGMTAASINRGEGLTGCGRSQLGAVLSCAPVCHTRSIPLISDGGVSSPADAFKALACGASVVMMGRSFAALHESAAEYAQDSTSSHKRYRGMSRPGIIGADMVAEGTEDLIEVAGTLRDFLSLWASSLKISISRAGARSIPELWHRVLLEGPILG